MAHGVLKYCACFFSFFLLPSGGAFYPHDSTPVNEQPAYGGTQVPQSVKINFFSLFECCKIHSHCWAKYVAKYGPLYKTE